MGLLKNAHLRCCPANQFQLHTLMYAPSLNLLSALNLDIFEQPPELLFINSPTIKKGSPYGHHSNNQMG